METSIPESQIPSETADCYDFPFSTSAVWASKTVKLLQLQGPTVEYGAYGDLIMIYPKPYSIYLRGTINPVLKRVLVWHPVRSRPWCWLP